MGLILASSGLSGLLAHFLGDKVFAGSSQLHTASQALPGKEGQIP